MTKNMGMMDRLVRAVVGIGLVYWALKGGGPTWAWIGVVPLLTAAIGSCPAYTIFGINTCPVAKN
ncbi:YgaP family membrane protein [Rhodoplanes roseus]|uniref:Inner membrane protein YgaP-like transmembrane domain-containing protein n=1 Tax=Rhodoplanes roseus TaxID=29409 RepID=A0A327L222_9BRAD|nr:DUF2892 domain-containing protein [Rhodoplanes roseus]RAI44536.1 hypothetical protein CH341_08765 [Rhodoplanes roseus]